MNLLAQVCLYSKTLSYDLEYHHQMLINQINEGTRLLLSLLLNDPKMWLLADPSFLHSKLVTYYRYHQKPVIIHRNSILNHKLLIYVQQTFTQNLQLFLNLDVKSNDLYFQYSEFSMTKQLNRFCLNVQTFHESSFPLRHPIFIKSHFKFQQSTINYLHFDSFTIRRL